MLAERPDLAKYRAALVAISKKEAAKPIIIRPPTLAVLLEKYPESMKYQTKPAYQTRLTAAEWERFALSLSDANLNGILSERLPRMVAAYVFSKDEEILKHIIAQLTEMAEWVPLERPGTNSTRQNLEYAAWLGTGWAVRAITGSLDILPPEAVPAELRGRLPRNTPAWSSARRNLLGHSRWIPGSSWRPEGVTCLADARPPHPLGKSAHLGRRGHRFRSKPGSFPEIKECAGPAFFDRVLQITRFQAAIPAP